MKMTEEGLDLIRRMEGFRADAYRDATGIWTIGFGHTSTAGSPAVARGMKITRAEAEAILARDIATFAKGVAVLVEQPLNDAQFSSLVSFAYNVGLGNFRDSSVLKAVNAGNFDAVPRRLQLWCKAGGRVLAGLVKRRAEEAAMFAGGADEPNVMPERPYGKAMQRSSTVIAALLTMLLGVWKWLTIGQNAEWAIVLGILCASAWVVRERWLKSRDDGV